MAPCCRVVPVASPLVMAEQALPEAVGRAMLDGPRSRPGVEWITVDLSAAQEARVSDSAHLQDGAIARYWRLLRARSTRARLNYLAREEPLVLHWRAPNRVAGIVCLQEGLQHRSARRVPAPLGFRLVVAFVGNHRFLHAIL